MGAGDDLDERRFAGPVFADEGVDFAGAQVEGDALEGLNAGEGFADAGGSQESSHAVDSGCHSLFTLRAVIATRTAERKQESPLLVQMLLAQLVQLFQGRPQGGGVYQSGVREQVRIGIGEVRPVDRLDVRFADGQGNESRGPVCLGFQSEAAAPVAAIHRKRFVGLCVGLAGRRITECHLQWRAQQRVQVQQAQRSSRSRQ